jgi:hypothetical protein
MSATTDIERRLEIWLDRQGPADVAPRVVEAALAEARSTHQRPAWRARWWWDPRRLVTAPWSAAVGAPGAVEGVPTFPVVRPRLGWAWVVAVIALLLALVGGAFVVGALLRTSPLPALACPPSSRPDLPGPSDQARPGSTTYGESLAWDGRAGRLVLFEPETGTAWSFDVCTNTWHAGRSMPGLPDRASLTYDERSGLLIAIGASAVWTYDPGTDTWVRRDGSAPDVDRVVAYDPVEGLVFARGVTTTLWAYDVAADSWRQADQGSLVPPAAAGYQTLGFDRSADRLVLLADGVVWLFDPHAGRWSWGASPSPVGFFIGGDLMAYDEHGERLIVADVETVAAYSATTDRWEVLSHVAIGQGAGLSARAYDPVNDRLVVVGADVRAFDLRTGRWVVLVPAADERGAASPGPSPTGGRP